MKWIIYLNVLIFFCFQLRKSINQDSIKKYVFKYWDKHCGGQFKTIMSLFSIRPAAKLVLAHWLIEWHGGSEKVKQLIKSLENKKENID